jgi:hypothetical protein
MDFRAEHLIAAFAIAAVIVWGFQRLIGCENFSSKREKAEAIAQWSRSGNLSYDNYRTTIPGADIVEYSDVKKILMKSPDVGELAKAVGSYR